MVDKVENLNPTPTAETTAIRNAAVDNQTGGQDRSATATATEAMVKSQALPGIEMTGMGAGATSTLESTVSMPPETGPAIKNGDKQDVLSAADKRAIDAAKASGDATIVFDDAFYSKVEPVSGKGALGDFDKLRYETAGQVTTRGLSGDRATTTTNVPVSSEINTNQAGGDRTTNPEATATATSAAAAAANLHKSDRLTARPDGSADTTVKPGDNLWKIAREALKQNKPEEYKPTDREVMEAVRRIAEDNKLRNPNLIRPGEKIHIPKELITKPPEVAPPSDARKPPEVPLEVRNASPEFAAEVKRQFDALPENVRRLLAENGTKVVVGGKISDADPSLAGVRPRGWPPGTTWDDDDGMFNPNNTEITVAEKHRDRQTGEMVPNTRVEGSVKHETGHAVDLALGNMSHSEDFKRAFDADVARMSPEDKARFAYLLQDGHAGHEETFAEVFGAMHGSSANGHQSEDILKDFPSVKALIQRRLAQLP